MMRRSGERAPASLASSKPAISAIPPFKGDKVSSSANEAQSSIAPAPFYQSSIDAGSARRKRDVAPIPSASNVMKHSKSSTSVQKASEEASEAAERPRRLSRSQAATKTTESDSVEESLSPPARGRSRRRANSTERNRSADAAAASSSGRTAQVPPTVADAATTAAPANADDDESSLSEIGSSSSDSITSRSSNVGPDSSGKRDATSSIDEPPSPAAQFGLPTGSSSQSTETSTLNRRKAPTTPTQPIPTVVVSTVSASRGVQAQRAAASASTSAAASAPPAPRRGRPPGSGSGTRLKASLSAGPSPMTTLYNNGEPISAAMSRSRSGASARGTNAKSGARKVGRAAEIAAEEMERGGGGSSSGASRKRSRSPAVYTPRSRRTKTDAEKAATEAKRQKLLSELDAEEETVRDASHPLLVELYNLLDADKERKLALVRRRHELLESYLDRLNEERTERTMCMYLDEKTTLQTDSLLDVQLRLRRMESELMMGNPHYTEHWRSALNLEPAPDPAPYLPAPHPSTLGPKEGLPPHALVAALDRHRVKSHDVWRLKPSEADNDVAFLKYHSHPTQLERPGGERPVAEALPPTMTTTHVLEELPSPAQQREEAGVFLREAQRQPPPPPPPLPQETLTTEVEHQYLGSPPPRYQAFPPQLQPQPPQQLQYPHHHAQHLQASPSRSRVHQYQPYAPLPEIVAYDAGRSPQRRRRSSQNQYRAPHQYVAQGYGHMQPQQELRYAVPQRVQPPPGPSQAEVREMGGRERAGSGGGGGGMTWWAYRPEGATA